MSKLREIPKIEWELSNRKTQPKSKSLKALQQWAEEVVKEIALEILAKDDLQERNELQFKQIKKMEENIQDYAKFCIECYSIKIKPLDYNGYLELNKD